MKEERLYNIDIYGLRLGKHEFTYDVDDRFFAMMPDTLVEKGKLKVNLELQKSENMIVLQFAIQGVIILVCDRSLEEFEYPLKSDGRLILKYGEEFKEVSDELIVIPSSTATINIAQYIYEFITMEVPYKKLHPRFQEDEDDDDILVYGDGIIESDDEDVSSEEENEKSPDEPVDPRFAALLKLKNNNLQ